MRLWPIIAALTLGCTPLPQCPDCPRAPTQATRTVCVDEAFAGDLPAVRAAVARWDAALCGVVRVTSRVVDPVTEPCALTVLRVDPAWQWVTARPANAPGWADPERGLAWIVTPINEAAASHVIGLMLQPIAEHEVGHLLGATHDTMGTHPSRCISHGAAVEAAFSAGRGSAGRTER